MDNTCTYWLDGWPAWFGGRGDEWLHCCLTHDQFYSVAHTFGGYVVAHWHLATCVAEVSWAMAGTMLLGLIAATFAIGKKILPRWHQNWGK